MIRHTKILVGFISVIMFTVLHSTLSAKQNTGNPAENKTKSAKNLKLPKAHPYFRYQNFNTNQTSQEESASKGVAKSRGRFGAQGAGAFYSNSTPSKFMFKKNGRRVHRIKYNRPADLETRKLLRAGKTKLPPGCKPVKANPAARLDKKYAVKTNFEAVEYAQMIKDLKNQRKTTSTFATSDVSLEGCDITTLKMIAGDKNKSLKERLAAIKELAKPESSDQESATMLVDIMHDQNEDPAIARQALRSYINSAGMKSRKLNNE